MVQNDIPAEPPYGPKSDVAFWLKLGFDKASGDRKSLVNYSVSVATRLIFFRSAMSFCRLWSGRQLQLKCQSDVKGVVSGHSLYSHSSRLNELCIISMRRRPSGCSESLWSSCSTASTASGYHFVIRVITGGLAAVAVCVIPQGYYTAKTEV